MVFLDIYISLSVCSGSAFGSSSSPHPSCAVFLVAEGLLFGEIPCLGRVVLVFVPCNSSPAGHWHLRHFILSLHPPGKKEGRRVLRGMNSHHSWRFSTKGWMSHWVTWSRVVTSMSWWLDWMILSVFPTLTILWFYDSKSLGVEPWALMFFGTALCSTAA